MSFYSRSPDGVWHNTSTETCMWGKATSTSGSIHQVRLCQAQIWLPTPALKSIGDVKIVAISTIDNSFEILNATVVMTSSVKSHTPPSGILLHRTRAML